MIISDTHKYLFIEIPLTASYAVRQELCTSYGGVPILHKHAGFSEFLRIARPSQREYFVFATVRHPLDVAVSRYFKLKTDHKGGFSDPASADELRVDYSDLDKFRFVQEQEASFAAYFRRYHKRPYSGMINSSRRNINFVMRYESLQKDFSALLHRLGIDQVRPVPVVNVTRGRRKEWEAYYTADIIEQAKANFGPFMREWGYQFPASWGEYSRSVVKGAEYRLLQVLAGAYLRHVRYSDGAAARFVRKVRVLLVK